MMVVVLKKRYRMLGLTAYLRKMMYYTVRTWTQMWTWRWKRTWTLNLPASLARELER